MKVTPLDIRRKEFRRSVRGYLDEDVDVFLDAVADEVERVSKMNSDLEAKVKSLEEEVASHGHIHEALENTLVAAQVQSEEMKAKAQQQSQTLLREAEAKAKTVVDDLYTQAESVQQSLVQLKQLEQEFRAKFKGMLEDYLRSLATGPVLTYVTEAAEPMDATEAQTGAREVVPGPPSLPTDQEVQQGKGLADDDSTVEVSRVSERAGGSVYFGKQQQDLDDPFPEIGGDSAQPRDFAW